MATSVLGKRSRKVLDAEDITTDLPTRKRRAQASVPQIYEDETPSTLRKSRSVNTRNARTKRIVQNTSVTNDLEIIDTCKTYDIADDGSFQDENLPPSITATPTTNRIKDVLGLKTPSTPKHRVRLGSNLLTPRSSRVVTPKSRQQTVFGAARQLFTQSDKSARLVGRDAERQQVHQFIADAIAARSGGCTYISGPPGTGKSALVHEVFQGFEGHEDVDVSIINCVSLRSSGDVYGKLLNDFSPTATTGKAGQKLSLSKLFLSKSKSRARLVLLDEIDSLLDSECDVLYTIFEWALHQSSSLILVGIANALDLTDRFLPRLKVRGLKPELLPFLPYTGTQISNIISEKLRSLLPANSTVDAKFTPLLQPAAVQLCGKKIASQSGDLRKAFGLVRRVIDQLEADVVAKQSQMSSAKQPLGEISNLNYPPTPPSSGSKGIEVDSTGISAFTVETAPRASIAHVARLASSIFNHGTLSRLHGLNLQQKAVLCSLVSRERRQVERNPFITPSKSANRVPTVKDLFVKYTILCERDEGLLQPLKDTEFRDVVASLETLGLVHEHTGRTSSLLTPTSSSSRAGRADDQKRIVSAVSEKEMRESLSGAGADLLRRLLEEV